MGISEEKPGPDTIHSNVCSLPGLGVGHKVNGLSASNRWFTPFYATFVYEIQSSSWLQSY